MARTSRNKPTSTGPGRGSPRTRTAARPGERAAAHRSRPRQLDVAEEEATVAPRGSSPAGRRRTGALGVTWRLITLAVVVAVLAVTLAQSLRVYFAQAQELADLRVEIQTRRDDIARLEDELARWDDPQFVKAEARERLGWVMPGDTGYRVIGLDGKPLGGDSALLHAEDKQAGPWQDRLWGSVAAADRPVAEDGDEDLELPPAPTTTIMPSPSATPTRTQ